jgi:hypothetical protein
MALDATIRPNLTLATYNDGHIFYTRTEARRRLEEDARAFYGEATNAGAEEANALEAAWTLGRAKSAAEGDLPSLAPSVDASVRHLSRNDP